MTMNSNFVVQHYLRCLQLCAMAHGTFLCGKNYPLNDTVYSYCTSKKNITHSDSVLDFVYFLACVSFYKYTPTNHTPPTYVRILPCMDSTIMYVVPAYTLDE